MRARQLFVQAAVIEMAAMVVFAALVLTLVYTGADLAVVIGVSGTIPMLSGVGAAVVVRLRRLPFRFRPGAATREEAIEFARLAGYVSLSETAGTIIYALDRVILGVFQSAVTVGLYEGPVRAHNLVRALNAALSVTVLPTASRYFGESDEARLSGELPHQGDAVHARAHRAAHGDRHGVGTAAARGVARTGVPPGRVGDVDPDELLASQRLHRRAPGDRRGGWACEPARQDRLGRGPLQPRALARARALARPRGGDDRNSGAVLRGVPVPAEGRSRPRPDVLAEPVRSASSCLLTRGWRSRSGSRRSGLADRHRARGRRDRYGWGDRVLDRLLPDLAGAHERRLVRDVARSALPSR